MREFDPRHDAPRAFALTPKLAAGAVAVVALAFGWKLALAGGRADPPPQDPKVLAALEHEAFAGAEAQPGFTRPENVPVKVLPGETLEAAVQRAGVAPDDARQAVTTLAQAMDIVHIKAGMAFDMMDTTFFLSRESIVASDRRGMPIWRDKLFAFMQRNALAATAFFRIPGNRLIELGTQVEI